MPDASKLSFPVQLVIWIVTSVLAVAGSVWGSQAGLRSDVRNILTQQEWSAKLQDDRASAMRDQLNQQAKQQELQRLKIEDLTLQVTEIRLKMKG